MINANELRIGNYIMTLAGIWPVVEILDDCITVNVEGQKIIFDYENNKPIELYPKLLDECGFVDHETYWSDGFMAIKKIHQKYMLLIGSETTGRLFQYLHELQNLYFAHTGLELDIEF